MLEETHESPLDCEEIQPVHPEGVQSWVFIGRTDVEAEAPIPATWCKELTHLKRPWCWERLKARGEGDDRGWGGWITSLTQWTWVWVNSGSWLWTGRPGVLRFMGLKSLDRTEQLNWSSWWRYLMHIFCVVFSDPKTPTRGRCQLLDDPERIAPRPPGAWRLIIWIIIMTLICYVTINGAENCAWAGHILCDTHTPPPTRPVRLLCWNPWRVLPFWVLPVLDSVWHFTTNAALSFTTWCQ